MTNKKSSEQKLIDHLRSVLQLGDISDEDILKATQGTYIRDRAELHIAWEELKDAINESLKPFIPTRVGEGAVVESGISYRVADKYFGVSIVIGRYGIRMKFNRWPWIDIRFGIKKKNKEPWILENWKFWP